MKRYESLDALYKESLKIKRSNGITLIALVITIIILLILAGITILQLSGNGLFDKTKKTKDISDYTSAKEQVEMKLMEIQVGCEYGGKPYTFLEIIDGMKASEEIKIQLKTYYTSYVKKDEIKMQIEENKNSVIGIVVSVDQYPEYNFLIGKQSCKIDKVLYIKDIKENSYINENDFIGIEEFEEKYGIQTAGSSKTTNPQIVIKNEKIQLYKNETAKIEVQLKGIKDSIIYTSSDDSIVLVDNAGNVTAVGDSGVATITLQAG